MLDAGKGAAWQNKVTGWFGAHHIQAVFPLAIAALVQLNEEGTKLLTSHLDDPSMDDFSTDGKAMLKSLVER